MLIHLTDRDRVELVSRMAQARSASTRAEMSFHPMAIQESVLDALQAASRHYAQAANLLRRELPGAGQDFFILLDVPQSDGTREARSYQMIDCCCAESAVQGAVQNADGGEGIAGEIKVLAVIRGRVDLVPYTQVKCPGSCQDCA